MYASTHLLTALGALSSAAPLTTTTLVADSKNVFHVQNFVFGCTTTCDWSYDITVVNNSTNHPSTGAVHCQGSLDTIKSFDDSISKRACVLASTDQQIATFIEKSTNRLAIQYSYERPPEYKFWYEGNKTVNAATSGKAQATDFYIKETKAYAVG